jgi:hypothetical protein
MVMFLQQALLIVTFVPSILGAILGRDSDVSALLKRMESLETIVGDLTTKVERQEQLIESLETLVSTSRMLLDGACYLTFFNETGTPTCSVNHHLTAGKSINVVYLHHSPLLLFVSHKTFSPSLVIMPLMPSEHGLAVLGNASFDGGTNYTFEVNATSNIQGPVTFSDRATFNNGSIFDENASFRKGVEFVGQGVNGVTFSSNTGTTFNGPAVFNNKTSFEKKVDFYDDGEYDCPGKLAF